MMPISEPIATLHSVATIVSQTAARIIGTDECGSLIDALIMLNRAIATLEKARTEYTVTEPRD